MNNTPRLRSDAEEQSIRLLWEETDLPAWKIAQRHGTTKNAVIALANRRGWAPRGNCRLPESGTLIHRLDGLNARMDQVLRETSTVLTKAYTPTLVQVPAGG